MPEAILGLVGEGVIRRKELLKRWLAPEWKILPVVSGDAKAKGEFEDFGKVVAAIGMPGALPWRSHFPDLGFLQLPGAGLDGLDVNQLPARALVSNVYEHEGSIAEYVFAAIFNREATWLNESAHQLKNGLWPYFDRIGGGPRPSITRKTIGICGWGRIGKKCADAALAFNMNVKVYSRSSQHQTSGTKVEFVKSLSELVQACDFLLLSLPLNGETKGIVDRNILNLTKKGTVVINIARAGLIDEDALFEALESRHLGGAILDVWYQYPASQSERITGSRLPFDKLNNVIMTPHLAANTDDMVLRRWQFMAENLNRYMRNEAPLNRVN